MTYGISSWIPVFVEPSTLMKNMSSWLDRIVTIRATEVLIVVATTRQNGTRSLLTSAKLLVGYLVVGITRELDKEPSLYYPLYIYMAPGPCCYLIFFYSFICVFLKATMLPTCALTSYS